VRESFSPFGARRGSNWQGIPTSGDYSAIQSTTRQGFTGQEMLDSVSLVHMNGRVYDPTLGRFLSADNVIQSLGSSQAINPFAYAWNDPLRYTDPTGHSLLGDIIGLIVAIIAIYLMQPELFYAEGATLTASTAFISGFAGGFFGALVSTGSLDAALTAGLIGGVTALAFYQVGSWAKGGNWTMPENVLAHAAVGCGSAVLSGGNCGRGALSAAVTEAAEQLPVIKPAAIGTWGAVYGSAEAGLLGGVSSEITGGNFSDGFSVGAAGYLFNSAAHTYMDKGDSTAQQLQAAAAAGASCWISPLGVTYAATVMQTSPGTVLFSMYVPIVDSAGVGPDLEADPLNFSPQWTLSPVISVHMELLMDVSYDVSAVTTTYRYQPWLCTQDNGPTLQGYVPGVVNVTTVYQYSYTKWQLWPTPSGSYQLPTPPPALKGW
jgi:RHS repeat-associated protein